MKRTLLVLSFIGYAAGFLAAQGPTSVWTLCDSLTLTFDSTSGPVISGAHPMIAYETYSTLSDEQGTLLAYSNGGGLWNAQHELMYNAEGIADNAGPVVYGSSLSTGIAFVPINSGEGLYGLLLLDGIFDSVETKNSLKMSIIDMRLDSGRGGVVDSSKATLIRYNLTEHLHVIRHANNTDWWILTKDNDSDSLRMNVDLLSGQTVSESGTFAFENNLLGDRGVLSSSPDGCMLAMSTVGPMDSSYIGLFRFDRALGVLKYLDHQHSEYIFHGTCFSPSSQLLYAAATGPFRIVQFDLIDENLQNFDLVFEPSWGMKARSGFIQRGDDQKLYFSMEKALPPSIETVLDDYLGSIREPDALGVACTVVPDYMFLQEDPLVGGFLPVFPNYVRSPQACFPDTTTGLPVHHDDADRGGGVFANSVGTWFVANDPSGSILLYDVSGRLRKRLSGAEASFNFLDLPIGVYIVRQQSEGSYRTQKILVAR